MDKLTLPRPDICPPWCGEHYTGTCGTRNHIAPADRYVLGESAGSGEPLSIAVWAEMRVSAAGVVSAVGVVETAADIELSRDELRQLSAHLLAVAAQLDAVLQG